VTKFQFADPKVFKNKVFRPKIEIDNVLLVFNDLTELSSKNKDENKVIFQNKSIFMFNFVKRFTADTYYNLFDCFYIGEDELTFFLEYSKKRFAKR